MVYDGFFFVKKLHLSNRLPRKFNYQFSYHAFVQVSKFDYFNPINDKNMLGLDGDNANNVLKSLNIN
jgi:hypothetical protein